MAQKRDAAHKRGRTHPIVDRAAGKRVARWVIATKPGSWSELRRKPELLGISQSTLSRLAAGQLPAVNEATIDRLHHLAYAAKRDDIAVDVVDMTTRENELTVWADGYQRWMVERAQRLVRSSAPHWNATRHLMEIVRDEDVHDPPASDLLFMGELRGVALRRYHNLWSLVTHLDKTAPTEGVLSRFEAWMELHGHDHFRRNLALLRIVEPLMEAAESAFVERQWEEMTERELIAFVRAGIRREKILLSRSPNEVRIREVTAEGPAALRRRPSFPRSKYWPKRRT